MNCPYFIQRRVISIGGLMFPNLFTGILVWILGGLFLVGSPAQAEAKVPDSAGIWRNLDNENRMSEAHETQLIGRLQKITGLENLAFDDQGSLKPGEIGCAAGGSMHARKIFLEALASGDVFIIEDHSSSRTVNFGQLDEGMKYEDVGRDRKFQIWRVRLDFNDFRQMEASDEVRESFDIGFTFLHEILHGLGCQDADHEAEIGECEEKVNKARAELGLPLRDQYFGDVFQFRSQIISVRVRFRSQVKSSTLLVKSGGEARTRDKLQYLFFSLPFGQTVCQASNGAAALECGPQK